MKVISVHHIEIGVQQNAGDGLVCDLQQKYGFRLSDTRRTAVSDQWVLRSGSARFLVTELRQPSDWEALVDSDPYIVPWWANSGPRSSVFNVCLLVRDIRLLEQSGVRLVKPMRTLADDHGQVTVATVRSCVGNVVHTLVQLDGYRGSFLPGFAPHTSCHCTTPPITHFDHITFAVFSGASKAVLAWYESNFGMKRFLMNRNENEDEGFVIDGKEIGIRLKAFEYWTPAEAGLQIDKKAAESMLFVIAESLPGIGPNQIDTFLEQHQGAGIQHIGLHTTAIVDTVLLLRERGVKFAEPPPYYYTEIKKYLDIVQAEESVSTLKKSGVLLDVEDSKNAEPRPPRYLLQKFTKPLFNRDTFFLEIIQRIGATGFGAGNVIALWRSLKASLQ